LAAPPWSFISTGVGSTGFSFSSICYSSSSVTRKSSSGFWELRVGTRAVSPTSSSSS
jgi:hypothetical protein